MADERQAGIMNLPESVSSKYEDKSFVLARSITLGPCFRLQLAGAHEKAPATVYWPSLAEDLYGRSGLGANRYATFLVRSDRTGSESFIDQARARAAASD